ncbi:MAG: glycosyltransferase family 4 protein [Puniceicoccaceae bacterium]
MRVLFVSSSSGSQGGGEFFLIFLARALKDMGVEVGLWSASDSGMDGLCEMFAPIGPVFRNNYKNTYHRKSRSISHAFARTGNMSEIRKQWEDFAPDFLHINKQCLEDGLDLLKLAEETGIPQACTIHITQTASELKAFLGGVRDWIARSALKKYRFPIWAISQQRAEELGNFVGLDEAVPFVANGVAIPGDADIEKNRVQMRQQFSGFIQDGSTVAVTVGRIEEQKNPFRFLEILGQWKSAAPDLVGIWVGDGRLRDSFESRIDEIGARDWIKCVGWVDDAGPYLSVADVYVHPARFEGLPFALLEAMSYRLPCVLSPSLANELKDMPLSTWLIAEDDPESWITSIQDRDLMDELAESARSLIEEKFSEKVMAQSYINLYESVIEKGK